MYGIQAITANNGWAMALAGALIVFSGLIVLSLAISQLHKLLLIFEKKGAADEAAPAGPPVSHAMAGKGLENLDALVELYQQHSGVLGESFYLADLYTLALRDDLPHPHLSIKTFREAGLLISQGEDRFAWHATGAA